MRIKTMIVHKMQTHFFRNYQTRIFHHVSVGNILIVHEYFSTLNRKLDRPKYPKSATEIVIYSVIRSHVSQWL